MGTAVERREEGGGNVDFVANDDYQELKTLSMSLDGSSALTFIPSYRIGGRLRAKRNIRPEFSACCP